MTTTTDDSPPHDFNNVMAQVFLWILLAGFLVLPSTFPNIQTIVKGSGALTNVVHTVRNVPLYVPSFPLVPLRPTKKGFSGSIFIFALTCGREFNQQASSRFHLLRNRHVRAVFALVEMVAQIRLASQHYLHPRDVQWPLWRHFNVCWHLWLAARRTLWQDNNCHCRCYWRVLRHLWVSIVDICVPEASTSMTWSLKGVTAVVIRGIGCGPRFGSQVATRWFSWVFGFHTPLGVIEM